MALGKSRDRNPRILYVGQGLWDGSQGQQYIQVPMGKKLLSPRSMYLPLRGTSKTRFTEQSADFQMIGSLNENFKKERKEGSSDMEVNEDIKKKK